MSDFEDLYEKVKTPKAIKPKSVTESYEKIMEAESSKLFVSKRQVRDAGRVVRRKRVAKKGYTYNADTHRADRIEASDHDRMSRAARLAAVKRIGQRSEMKYKHDLSIRRRKSLGWDKPKGK